MLNRNGNYPASVQSGIPNLPETPRGWEKEPLGKHLIEIKRPVDMVNDVQYQLVIAKRSRGGVVAREKLLGKGIKVKSQFYVKAGDFLISKRQIVHGACDIVPNKLDGAIVSGEYAVLGTNGGINIAYLKHLSESVHFQQTCFQSSIGVHVEKMVFKIDRWLKWDFNIPPLPEQKRIASILSTVDDKISSIENQIKQTEQLKKGLMEKFLSEGIGHTEFKDTKIGRIPASWDVVNINGVSERKSGHTPNKKIPKYWNGGIKWVSLADSYRLDKLYIDETDNNISEEGIKNSSAVKLQKGAVIISRDAGIGKSTIINDVMAVSQHFIAWECGDSLLNVFLFYLLQKWKKKFEQIANGTTIKTIGLDFFKKMEIPLPPFEEQKQIASILTTVDGKIDVLISKKSEYQTLKKGLSQQLLTGQMRVKV